MPKFEKNRGLSDLDDTAQEAILSKLADSTRRSYGAGWKQWQLFLASSGRDPFLSEETRAERLEDEQWLIRFVVFLRQRMGRTAQGIRQRLSGIRYAHIASKFMDPLKVGSGFGLHFNGCTVGMALRYTKSP